MQCRLQLAVADEWKALLCSPHGCAETGLLLLTPERPTLGSSRITPGPVVTAVTSWPSPALGRQGLKNCIHKTPAILKGSELQRCSLINQMHVLATSAQSQLPGKKSFLSGIHVWGFALWFQVNTFKCFVKEQRKRKSSANWPCILKASSFSRRNSRSQVIIHSAHVYFKFVFKTKCGKPSEYLEVH